MDNLISRQAAIDAECEVCQIAPKKERGHNCTYYANGCKEIECLRALPSAKRKNGEWEVAIGYDPNKKVMCTNCRLMSYEPTPFCPNCGADMRGEEDE